jgi:hypothetical protein
MARENLNLTAQIVMSCASMTELTRKELLDGIKRLYALLPSIDAETVAEKPGGKRGIF